MTHPNPDPTPADQPAADQPKPKEPADNDGALTLTQGELRKKLTAEKDQGRRAAERALLDRLGVASLDAAEDIVRQAQEREEAGKTEAQRAREQLDRFRADVEREKSAATLARHQSRIEIALVRAGVTDPQRLEFMSKSLIAQVEPDGDIEGAVDDTRRAFPELFGSRQATHSDPRGRPQPTPEVGGGMAAGAARYQQWKQQQGIRLEPGKP